MIRASAGDQRHSDGGVAEECARSGTRLVFISTDLVFNGERGGYREEDEPAPLSVYGRSKRDAEAIVRASPNSVVVRLSLLYGPSLNGCPSFFDEQTVALRTGRNVTLFTDEWRTPLDLPTAARALAALAAADATGLLHIGGPERLSRYEMGLRLASSLGAECVGHRRRDARQRAVTGATAARYVAGFIALACGISDAWLAAFS